MATVTFNGLTYIEPDINNPVMTTFMCGCGNEMRIPLGAVVLGITDSCNHCHHSLGFPRESHQQAITQGWTSLVEDGDICLD